MKRCFVFLAVLVILGALCAGCATPAEEAEQEPAAVENPFKGVGVKPDGSPYVFGHTVPHMWVEWTVVSAGLVQSYADKAGAEVTTHDPQMDLSAQISIIEDLVEKGVDGILLHAVDTSGIVPVLDKAKAAGIPVFVIDMLVDSPTVVCSVTHDQLKCGYVNGQWFIDKAEENGEQINIYELWGIMGQEGAERRHAGLHDAVDGHPMITVLESPDTGWQNETAMNFVLDTLPSHPEINAIFIPGGVVPGVLEALRTMDRLHPVGHPDHIHILSIDEDPNALDAIRNGYIDGTAAHSAYRDTDAAVKAMFTQVCCGRDIPELIEFDTYVVDASNINDPLYGAPSIWGDMQRVNFDLWPILDLPEDLIATPTVEMKKEGC